MTKTKPTKTETISERTWQGRQSWNREIILRAGEHKLRIEVKVDSYDFQSYGKAEHWDGAKWHQVHHIAGQQLVAKGFAHARDVTAARFAADVAELTRVALAVVS